VVTAPNDGAFTQQPGRVVLVLDPDVQQHLRQLAEDGGEPRRHGVGIDGNGDPGTLRRSTTYRFGQRLGLEHRGLCS
jgi:hypothetical protein